MTEDAKLSLEDAIASLDDAIGAHWTKGGKPDLNALTELTGRKVTRGQLEQMPDRWRSDLGLGPDDEAVDEAPGLKTIDFVSLLDAVQSAMTENHRIYCPTLYRVMQTYRSEREGLVREFESARNRKRIQIVGLAIPIGVSLAPMDIDDDPEPVDPDA